MIPIRLINGEKFKTLKTSLEDLTTNFKFRFPYLCINLFMTISHLLGFWVILTAPLSYVNSLFQLWAPVSGGVNVKAS